MELHSITRIVTREDVIGAIQILPKAKDLTNAFVSMQKRMQSLREEGPRQMVPHAMSLLSLVSCVPRV